MNAVKPSSIPGGCFLLPIPPVPASFPLRGTRTHGNIEIENIELDAPFLNNQSGLIIIALSFALQVVSCFVVRLYGLINPVLPLIKLCSWRHRDQVNLFLDASQLWKPSLRLLRNIKKRHGAFIKKRAREFKG